MRGMLVKACWQRDTIKSKEKDFMKYVVWGAGIRGSRVLRNMGKENIVAFVDSSNDKIGTFFHGKKVVSLEEYEADYIEYFIVVSFTHAGEGEKLLKERGIEQYLLLCDCPPDFTSNNPPRYFENYIAGMIESDKKYGIKGRTLFSFWLYEYIFKKCRKEPILLIDQSAPDKIIKILKKNQYRVADETQMEQADFDRIFKSEFEDPPVVFCKDEINLFDCSDEIKEYHNPVIEKYKDKYRGKRCFIIGNGPSLDSRDLDMLKQKGEISFGVNSIFYAFEKTDWRPTYYVVVQGWECPEMYGKLEDMGCQCAFIGDTDDEFWGVRHDKKIQKFHVVCDVNESRLPLFSTDFSQKCYAGGTVVYSCMQLAVYMGFEEIYLIGVDFSYAEQESSYEHFYGVDSQVSIGYKERVILAYQAAKKYADAYGIKIYNATRGGKLELFERINFDDIFYGAD